MNLPFNSKQRILLVYTQQVYDTTRRNVPVYPILFKYCVGTVSQTPRMSTAHGGTEHCICSSYMYTKCTPSHYYQIMHIIPFCDELLPFWHYTC